MNYNRTWNNFRNAAGFAAECARLALPFYVGDKRSDVVAAIKIAENYATGRQIDRNAYDAGDGAYDAASAARVGGDDAAYAAVNAAYAATPTTYTSARAANAAYFAGRAGVDDSEILIAYARWVTRDLIGDRELPEELHQAAGAAIVAGDEDLARELIGLKND